MGHHTYLEGNDTESQPVMIRRHFNSYIMYVEDPVRHRKMPEDHSVLSYSRRCGATGDCRVADVFRVKPILQQLRSDPITGLSSRARNHTRSLNL